MAVSPMTMSRSCDPLLALSPATARPSTREGEHMRRSGDLLAVGSPMLGEANEDAGLEIHGADYADRTGDASRKGSAEPHHRGLAETASQEAVTVGCSSTV